ncbi:hypothetical protein GCM10027074_54750 [Streptomyces deserti]
MRLAIEIPGIHTPAVQRNDHRTRRTIHGFTHQTGQGDAVRIDADHPYTRRELPVAHLGCSRRPACSGLHRRGITHGTDPDRAGKG